MPPTTLAYPLPPRRRRARFPWLIVGGTVGAGALVAAALLVALLLFAATPARVAAGVLVAGVDVGGASETEAARLISDLAARPINLIDGDRQWQIGPADFGVRADVETTLREALRARTGADVPLRLSLDLTQTQNGLVWLSDQINIPASSSPTPQSGWVMEIPVMLDRLYRDPLGELNDTRFELNMMEVAPPAPEPTTSYRGEMTTHVVERGQELGLIARAYNVAVADIVRINGLSNPDLLYVGQELRIPAPGLYAPTAADAPPAPANASRAILVSTGDQRIYAYENGQLVRSHLVSTGKAETPTVLGDYRIYVKLVADDMSGPDYFLPQVPWTMYFYQGYAIHGTYWHNNFGRPMSHGCVNLPPAEAEWFFSFAEVGTLVRVI
jgi:lipoprotein-anchoring transpeptidase ErfK/SrfK